MVIRENLAAKVATELRAYIADQLGPGSQLPSEKELAERWGVSRNTLREALWLLWSEGLLVRRWGVGTFVADSSEPVVVSSTSIIPIRDAVRMAGHEPTVSHADAETIPAPAEIARALGLEEASPVWRVDRVFDVDETPAVFLRDYVPTRLNGRDLDLTPLTDVNIDLLTVLSTSGHTRIARMEVQMEAAGASGEIAVRLKAPTGHPLLRAVQSSYSAAGNIVIFSDIHYRTDTIRLRFVRTART
ncbi:GntR family transcriptional regulator [Microbispora sp. CA-102843]|uniref:GntR family transcriptional regulator n=1 Tax=Microbispora sp. CA-102843 TaxID=3239952 RepID=UPI003D8E852F